MRYKSERTWSGVVTNDRRGCRGCWLGIGTRLSLFLRPARFRIELGELGDVTLLRPLCRRGRRIRARWGRGRRTRARGGRACARGRRLRRLLIVIAKQKLLQLRLL